MKHPFPFNIAIVAVLFLLMAGTGKSFAYDFSSVAPSGQTLYYSFSYNIPGTVMVTAPSGNGWYNFTKPQGTLVIPPTVEHQGVTYPVVEIDRLAFHLCTGITSVVIPNTVKSLYSQCFFNCTSLSSISIGSAVEWIDLGVFGNTAWYNSHSDGILYLDGWCLGIKGDYVIENGFLEIQEGTRGIGGLAFYNHNEITTLTIPNSVTIIGSQAFQDCVSLTSVTMGESVQSIKTNAFYNCAGLTSITLPSTLESIGYESFYECTGLTSVYFTGDLDRWCNITFEDNPLWYGHNLYVNNELVENLVIPETVTAIKDNAFMGASCLSTLSIPNSVTSIGYSAFSYCSGLTSLFIPSSVSFIETGAFIGCSGLESIIVEFNNPSYNSGNHCNAIIETATNTLHTGCKNTLIPNSVSIIGDFSFYDQTGLTSITIPSSVSLINSSAFTGCEQLASIKVLRITPPTLYSDLPSTTPGFTIYVPYGSLDVYKQHYLWSDYRDYMQPITTMTLWGYGETNGKWRFISSPLTNETSPLEIDEMIDTENSDHDLYRFDQTVSGAEWQNYKKAPFELVNGQGYLYANKEDVDLVFLGEFNESTTKQVDLVYDAGKPFAGWNLVGNPFPTDAYINRSYYVMNEAGTALNPVPASSATAIPTCTGLMVKANATGETVTFTRSTSKDQILDKGMLAFTILEPDVEKSDDSFNILDKAILSLNDCDALEKITLRPGQTTLSIVNEKEEYAIFPMGQIGECTLHFIPEKSGDYVLTVDPNKVPLDYLHLIDLLTGTDIDLLQQRSYSFYSQTTDDKGRFHIVLTPDSEKRPYHLAESRDDHTPGLPGAHGLSENQSAGGDSPSPTQQVLNLDAGWNWISLYLENDANLLSVLQAGLALNNTSVMIKNIDYSMMLQNGSWSASELTLTNESLYMLNLENATTVTLTGTLANSTNHPITLKPGWNWIGFPLDHSLPVTEALSGITPNKGDLIKYMTGSSSYNGTTWEGSLENLDPGVGYMYYNQGSTITLTYPSSK